MIEPWITSEIIRKTCRQDWCKIYAQKRVYVHLRVSWPPRGCSKLLKASCRSSGSSLEPRGEVRGVRTHSWDRHGKIRETLIRIIERVRAQGYSSTTTYAALHRLISPRCCSSTISSNIPSKSHLFCCRNRRHFMHRPPRKLSREKLEQPVCRLILPTIVRFFV